MRKTRTLETGKGGGEGEERKSILALRNFIIGRSTIKVKINIYRMYNLHDKKGLQFSKFSSNGDRWDNFQLAKRGRTRELH